jgi:hypothetical protein
MKKNLLFILVLMFAYLFSGCSKKEEIILQSYFQMYQPYNITKNSATVEGKFWTNYPLTDIDSVGYSLGSIKIYDSVDSVSVYSKKTDGIITCSFTGLQPNKLYYVVPKVKWKNGMIVWYDPQITSFTTLAY